MRGLTTAIPREPEMDWARLSQSPPVMLLDPQVSREYHEKHEKNS
jgi:hypothetical protein